MERAESTPGLGQCQVATTLAKKKWVSEQATLKSAEQQSVKHLSFKGERQGAGKGRVRSSSTGQRP